MGQYRVTASFLQSFALDTDSAQLSVFFVTLGSLTNRNISNVPSARYAAAGRYQLLYQLFRISSIGKLLAWVKFGLCAYCRPCPAPRPFVCHRINQSSGVKGVYTA
jgi:hypothetical protein